MFDKKYVMGYSRKTSHVNCVKCTLATNPYENISYYIRGRSRNFIWWGQYSYTVILKMLFLQKKKKHGIWDFLSWK